MQENKNRKIYSEDSGDRVRYNTRNELLLKYNQLTFDGR